MARNIELYSAWLLASLGTLLSLYFSDIRHLEPCHMCWYQRICLFPLVIILGIAAYRSFFDIARYVLPLVIIGFLFAIYQIAIQEIPGWNPIDICGGGPSCSEKYDIGLGPITIPMLSAGGFFVIGILLLLSWKRNTSKQER
jgi:disulfide bond formation protein DsbB